MWNNKYSLWFKSIWVDVLLFAIQSILFDVKAQVSWLLWLFPSLQNKYVTQISKLSLSFVVSSFILGFTPKFRTWYQLSERITNILNKWINTIIYFLTQQLSWLHSTYFCLSVSITIQITLVFKQSALPPCYFGLLCEVW